MSGPETRLPLSITSPREREPSGAALLRVEHLDVSLNVGGYFNHAVVDVSFEVGQGARVGIVGETGSGKSVTALSIMCLHHSGVVRMGQASHIWFDDVDVLTLPREAMRRLRGTRISMVFQDPMTSLNPVIDRPANPTSCPGSQGRGRT